jgi:hypothetical protein
MCSTIIFDNSLSSYEILNIWYCNYASWLLLWENYQQLPLLGFRNNYDGMCCILMFHSTPITKLVRKVSKIEICRNTESIEFRKVSIPDFVQYYVTTSGCAESVQLMRSTTWQLLDHIHSDLDTFRLVAPSSKMNLSAKLNFTS